MNPPRTRLAALVAVALVAAVGGCAGGLGADRPNDQRYGHRYPGVGPDGRETVLLTPPADSVRYLVYPAIVDSVLVRPARRSVEAGSAIPVEALIKGALPDACSELDDVTQERAGHLIRLTLTMRQPRGPACAQVVRPFRFYVLLDGEYGPGSYTLTLNDTAHPFQIFEARPEGSE